MVNPLRFVNRRIACVILFLFFLLLIPSAGNGQANYHGIAGIDQIVAQVNEQVAQSESQDEYSSIFRTELVINQRENPWPAVGIYQRTVRFYFTYGDREKDPYPNRLLKITVTTKRSSRHEYEEYVFNPAGQLVFSLVKDSDDTASDRKYYFVSGRLLGAWSGSKEMNVRDRATVEAARSLLKENRKLVAIFQNSLE